MNVHTKNTYSDIHSNFIHKPQNLKKSKCLPTGEGIYSGIFIGCNNTQELKGTKPKQNKNDACNIDESHQFLEQKQPDIRLHTETTNYVNDSIQVKLTNRQN